MTVTLDTPVATNGIGRFQILSLDGGGIKGIFAAALLAKIEEDTGRSIVDHFDLIAGTSTGGIIAIALGLGMRPAEIVAFYEEHGPYIFGGERVRRLLHPFFRKYPSGYLERALQEAFGSKRFGDSTKRLVIPAYNIGADDVYLFRTSHAPYLVRDYRLPAWQVAMATSAAPTFFNAFTRIDHMRLIDGGVWANNPAMIAVVEAVTCLGVDMRALRVFSVGTTDEVRNRPERLNGGGLIAWASSVPEVIMRAQSVSAANHTKLLLSDRYLRMNPVVPVGIVRLDKHGAVHKLLSAASHESRRIGNVMNDMFFGHVATPFRPEHE